MINEPKFSPRIINLIGGVLLTAGLMFGFALAPVYAYRLVVGSNFFTSIVELLLIIIGTAVGAAIGFRVVQLNWRQTAAAALISDLSLIALSRFVPSFPGPWVPGGSGMVLDPASTLIYLVIGTAGVFLLPLFDPAVRQTGLALPLRVVAVAALSCTVLAIVADYLIGGGSFFGLLTLIFGSIAAAVLAGIGLILALLNLTAAGAWLGGLGVMLQTFILVAWWLLGTPWFP